MPTFTEGICRVVFKEDSRLFIFVLSSHLVLWLLLMLPCDLSGSYPESSLRMVFWGSCSIEMLEMIQMKQFNSQSWGSGFVPGSRSMTLFLRFFSQAVNPHLLRPQVPSPVLVPTVNVRPAPSAMAWTFVPLAKVLCWSVAPSVAFLEMGPPSSRLSEVLGVEPF